MNPFDTTTCNFKLSFQVKFREIPYFEDFLDFVADSVSTSEVYSETIESMPEDLWLIEAFFEDNPEFLFKDKIYDIASKNSVIINNIDISKIEDKDWVSEVQRNFRPFEVGRFFIASKYYESSQESNLQKIIINPSRAFGTGEHQTTKACILSLESLYQHEKYVDSIADIGTGTGILAIAASKIWHPSMVYASDIEEISCKIAKENSVYNNSENIHIIHSDGFKAFGREKFDLIISNILLKPLLDNADNMSLYLNQGGYLILSGFLKNQETILSTKFFDLGFSIKNEIYIDDWASITYKKIS